MRGAGAARASPSLSRAEAGAERSAPPPQSPGLEGNRRNREPPGEGLRANAAGRLPRSPAPRPPPAPPAASAAASRSSAAFPAQSVSPRRWVSGGRSGQGWGTRGRGILDGGGPVLGYQSPPLPRLPGILPPRAQGAGAPPGKRAALSKVLTAERPARRSRVSASSERPLQEGPRASTQRIEAWALGEIWERFAEGPRGGFLRSSCASFSFWGRGGWSLRRQPSLYHPRFQVFQLGGAALRVAGRRGHWKIFLLPSASLKPRPDDPVPWTLRRGLRDTFHRPSPTHFLNPLPHTCSVGPQSGAEDAYLEWRVTNLQKMHVTHS